MSNKKHMCFFCHKVEVTRKIELCPKCEQWSYDIADADDNGGLVDLVYGVDSESANQFTKALSETPKGD